LQKNLSNSNGCIFQKDKIALPVERQLVYITYHKSHGINHFTSFGMAVAKGSLKEKKKEEKRI